MQSELHTKTKGFDITLLTGVSEAATNMAEVDQICEWQEFLTALDAGMARVVLMLSSTPRSPIPPCQCSGYLLPYHLLPLRCICPSTQHPDTRRGTNQIRHTMEHRDHNYAADVGSTVEQTWAIISRGSYPCSGGA